MLQNLSAASRKLGIYANDIQATQPMFLHAQKVELENKKSDLENLKRACRLAQEQVNELEELVKKQVEYSSANVTSLLNLRDVISSQCDDLSDASTSNNPKHQPIENVPSFAREF